MIPTPPHRPRPRVGAGRVKSGRRFKPPGQGVDNSMMNGPMRFYPVASSLCLALGGGVALLGMMVQLVRPAPPEVAWVTGGVLMLGIVSSGLFLWMGKRASRPLQLTMYGADPRIVERRPLIAAVADRSDREVEPKPGRVPEVAGSGLSERQAA